MATDDERARSLALLEATHRFPTDYALSVIARNDERVFVALRAAISMAWAEAIPDGAYERVESRAGNYASHRFRVRCASADDVLRLYERVLAVEGVITAM